MRIKIYELKRICMHEEIDILCYCGLRTCADQARLYRQSRTSHEINQKKQSLTDKGFPFLAAVIDEVGPQAGTTGKHVTKAGPGESWHQYALAADCVPVVGGKAVWDADDPRWEFYGQAAIHLGMVWAGQWPGFKEMPHVQLYTASNPLQEFRGPDIVKDRLREAKSL